MRIKFCGAAREVTGSQHLLMVGNKQILLDCGLNQGKREEAIKKNRDFLFDPKKIDAVVLSHAHIDHSGNLPNLVKQGFGGPIYCTSATADLSYYMLLDSAYIQEQDARYLAKHRIRQVGMRGPLYTTQHAQKAIEQLTPIKYGEEIELNRQMSLRFLDAGHVLGSAISLLTIKQKEGDYRLVYTGDLGRKGLPILRDPEVVKQADFLITESTYGNKEHIPVENIEKELQQVIKDTAKKGGKIIIPAFSLERTQELIYHLELLFEKKKIPSLPVFVDSPLAINLTEVFRKHPECYDKELQEEFTNNRKNPFGFGRIKYVTDVQHSKKLNALIGPAIIISASGMCENGRIRHHLANNIEDPRNTILIVGFMAEETLGRKLVEKRKVVRIFGKFC
ncbi:MAG TPA: MBL fold metallo-hydrolase, partial [Candidatus Peregrinibacteria bacterium]|nr:MBL fold metallo-hydrolase [Candidatus Peregrinibacteria bacterium]